MKKKIIGILVAVIVIIAGIVIYGKAESNKGKEKVQKQTEMKNLDTSSNSDKKNNDISINKDVNGGSENSSINQSTQISTSDTKPKMLTQKQLVEREKEVAEAWAIRRKHDKKYVSLDGVRDYIVNQGTTLLINKFPNQKENKEQIENKLKIIIDKTITPDIMKNKFRLKGSKYDLKQIGVYLTPIDDLGFALNINTNQIIENTNKDIAITTTDSAE